jgi:parallel beta-helix repeat protein
MKRTALALTLILVLSLVLAAGTQFVNLGVANFLPPPPELPYVYIRADGTIEPQIPSIQRVGETYTFTGNIINYTIEAQRDNIVIDGTGYTLQGNGTGKGIVLTSVTNVTIRNMTLRNLRFGIYLNQSSGDTITQNDITSTEAGVFSESSSNNDIDGNDITGNSQGIVLIEYSNHNNIVENRILENGMAGILLELSNDHTSDYNNIIRNNMASNGVFGMRVSSSSNCLIEENSISNSEYGIQLSGSACRNNKLVGNSIRNCSSSGIQMSADCNHNTIVENAIANNQIGIDIFASSNNEFYHNDFIKNTVQVNNGNVEDVNTSIGASINIWSNGFEGNFWSDYSARYPNATEVDSSGIWNTPYVIDTNNTDQYPLMQQVDVSVTAPTPTPATAPAAGIPLLTIAAISAVSAVVIVIGLLVYFKKRNHAEVTDKTK